MSSLNLDTSGRAVAPRALLLRALRQLGSQPNSHSNPPPLSLNELLVQSPWKVTARAKVPVRREESPRTKVPVRRRDRPRARLPNRREKGWRTESIDPARGPRGICGESKQVNFRWGIHTKWVIDSCQSWNLSVLVLFLFLCHLVALCLLAVRL